MPSNNFPTLGNPTGGGINPNQKIFPRRNEGYLDENYNELNPVVPHSNNNVLYQWGPLIQFKVWPMNIHEFDHETGTDWAQKEIAGGAIYREWVGENDEQLSFRGRLFPARLGGVADIDAFDAQRRLGIANLLVRGDGKVMGWFVCEKLVRAHTFLDWKGEGQQVAFETLLVRVPAPAAETHLGNLWRAAR